MTTYLLMDDALRSKELRHEISEGVGDPVVFIEHDVEVVEALELATRTSPFRRAA